MSKDNGGPDFPFVLESSGGIQFYEAGMTMRDYFAAKATDRDVNDVMNRSSVNLTRTQARYIHADNMLLERAK
jgi:hypothetical protein